MALAQVYVLIGYLLTTAGFAWRYGPMPLMVAGAVLGVFGLFVVEVGGRDRK